jgi:DNA-binding transcriptional regulator LsrR (DeoR family)
MPGPRERELLVRAARLYFEDGRSQQEVAVELGTSRSNVSRMLAAARETGIVEIRIHDPRGRDTVLERELADALGLADTVVAGITRGERAMDRVGDMGAVWLAGALADGQTIALSWGATLQRLVWSVAVDHPFQVEVTQLVGGLSAVSSGVTGQELVRELSDRLGAQYHYLHAPAVLTSMSTRDALMAEQSVTGALDIARRADLALVGIGNASSGSSAQILNALGLTERQRREFDARRPIGDIAARFFDADGIAIDGPVHDRVLAVELDDIRRIPMTMGVASGRDKARAIVAAARGRLIDGLISDTQTARAVLALIERGSPDTTQKARTA